MVTEIPGKGWDIVAARDIRKGELIFNDKPAITLPSYLCSLPNPKAMESLKTQIRKLPSEAKSQFYKLTAPDADPKVNMVFRILADKNGRDSEALKLFMANALSNRKRIFSTLYLKLSLVNHSCAPNAIEGELRPESETEDQVQHYELRAIQDISRVVFCLCLLRLLGPSCRPGENHEEVGRAAPSVKSSFPN